MKFWRMQREMIFMYSISHPEFFVPLRYYQPRDKVVLETLKDFVPSTWSIFISRLLCSKLWPRPGAGKLITIYPNDESRFIELIDEVDHATQGFQGPYILSDRRYKDSRVVYYRYGSFAHRYAINVYGEKESIIVFNGEKFSDKRTPYFKLPPWVTDLFEKVSSARAGVMTHER